MLSHPKFCKTLHSRYYRLPKVLWDYIWRYDDRYRNEFKQCIIELNLYFNRNRMIDHLFGDMILYRVYVSVNRTDVDRSTKCHSFYDYQRHRNHHFGDFVNPEFLKYDSLHKIPDPLQST